MPTPSSTVTTIHRLTPVFMVFVFLVIFGLISWFVLWPEFTKFLAGGSFNYQTQLDKLTSKNSYLTQLQKFNTLYDANKDGQANSINNILPTGKNTALLFAMHEALAKNYGLTLNSIDVVSPDSSGTNAGVNQLNVSLKLAGATYSNFKQYLRSLESFVRISDVDSVGYDVNTGTINLNLHTYYQGSGQ